MPIIGLTSSPASPDIRPTGLSSPPRVPGGFCLSPGDTPVQKVPEESCSAEVGSQTQRQAAPRRRTASEWLSLPLAPRRHATTDPHPHGHPTDRSRPRQGGKWQTHFVRATVLSAEPTLPDQAGAAQGPFWLSSPGGSAAPRHPGGQASPARSGPRTLTRRGTARPVHCGEASL